MIDRIQNLLLGFEERNNKQFVDLEGRINSRFVDFERHFVDFERRFVDFEGRFVDFEGRINNRFEEFEGRVAANLVICQPDVPVERIQVVLIRPPVPDTTHGR